MLLTEWLDAESGRTRRMAEHFGITPSAVSQWRTNGVPADNLLAVHEFTGRVVTLEELLRERGAQKAAA